MFKISVPIQAELIVEAEDVEAITRWIYALTFTDECTKDCLYQIRIANSIVKSEFQFDPAQIKAEAERQLRELKAA